MENQPNGPLLRRISLSLAAFAIGCLLLVSLLAAIEGVLRILAARPEPPKEHAVWKDLSPYTDDETPLGRKPRPGITHDEVTCDGKTIYAADYTVDNHSRRVTPCEAPEKRNRIAAFFGCSLTFGWGVRDDETLPARFAAHCPDCTPVNFAYGSYGPQQMWLQIKKLGVLNELPKEEGVVIYTFIDDHMNRLVGTHYVVAKWGYKIPRLTLENGQVKWIGSFSDSAPSLLTQYFGRLCLGQFVQKRLMCFDDNRAVSDQTFDLLERVLRECDESVRAVNPKLKFCCLLYPGYPGSLRSQGAKLADRLKGSDILVFDYYRLFEDPPMDPEQVWFRDAHVRVKRPWGHPKPLSYDLVAAKLAKTLCDGG